MSVRLPRSAFERIFDVLVEGAGVPDELREGFIETNVTAVELGRHVEFRIGGFLGFGGKFWNSRDRCFVNLYKEEETSRRVEIVSWVNDRISEIINDQVTDFLGNILLPGDFVAGGGKGNCRAEYGMILFRVEAVSPKLKLTRLDVSYPERTPLVKARSVTATNANKYVKVDVEHRIASLFERVIGDPELLTQPEREAIGVWIHGVKPVPKLIRGV